jgi:hypothetical protein
VAAQLTQLQPEYGARISKIDVTAKSYTNTVKCIFRVDIDRNFCMPKVGSACGYLMLGISRNKQL